MYKLVEEINANAIQGQEWAKGSKQLRFWQLDQALGVVVRKGDDLWGVHLTQVDSDSRAPFDEVAAASVLQLLPKVYDGAWLVGHVEEFSRGSVFGLGGEATYDVSRGYEALTGQLHNLHVDRPFIAKPLRCNNELGGLWESCVCTVKVSGNGVAIYYEAFHPQLHMPIWTLVPE